MRDNEHVAAHTSRHLQRGFETRIADAEARERIAENRFGKAGQQDIAAASAAAAAVIDKDNPLADFFESRDRTPLPYTVSTKGKWFPGRKERGDSSDEEDLF